MSFSSLLWVFMSVWICCCFYYAWQMGQIIRGKKISSMSDTGRIKLRKLVLNMVLATIFFALAVVISYLANEYS